ncbi:MAG: hypothetical protein WBD74_00820 [Candidatus Aquilonibacter sp.]
MIATLLIVVVLAFVLLLVGVNFGLRQDVKTLASQSVQAGSNALEGALASRVEQTRSLILQAASQPSLGRALQTHDLAALRSKFSDAAIGGDLSFVVATDKNGTVLVGSRDASGSLAKDGLFSSALGGPVLLDAPALRTQGRRETDRPYDSQRRRRRNSLHL